jgi:hypothetical protein
MQYNPRFAYQDRSTSYVEGFYHQDAATIEQLRQERQPQVLILTVTSPELHFGAAVGLCVEGTLSEVHNAE